MTRKKKKNKENNYFAARILGGSMMAVVLIIFGFVLGNMFGQKDGIHTNPQLAKAEVSPTPQQQRASVEKTAPRNHKPGQAKYSFYDELQRRSDEVHAEVAAKSEIQKKRSASIKGTNYRIQIGAFKDKKQAEQMRERMLMRNLPTEISLGEGNRYLVQIGPYASKDQAVSIQKKLENEKIQTLLKTFSNP
ncbi:MAG: SPOR domain-containing protein [Cardiobacteriaceae bacterium]|nr:SPOR domain-containing protein [Cardiobacteriaceae bacterium]